ncbi:hypothetical protein EDC45_0461 [Mesocricetibacter intestinalis]|uniref:Uncharacterized protein n=1 Tax=Mesocricetibacter intestinalis TaxID=1521930 RepID=A0A4R6VG65_9PAST|nr:hypothetical protein [Mesocricetibacter intestinalis]TDQ59801.1 hypothetical protein EDC45_0461 [Mesocricetibacter intestinalis]
MKNINLQQYEPDMGLGRYSWQQLIKWLLIALLIYALGSIFISNPFSIFVDRKTPVDYSRIMYFHGLAIGLAGLTCLIVNQVFNLDNKFKKIIFYCTLAAVFFGLSGGAINRSMEETKLMLWYQTLGFFALDGVLITLFIAFLYSRPRTQQPSFAYYLATISSGTAVIAALIGDLIGVMLDFGDIGGIFGSYASAIGYSLSEWNDNLLRSHSDMIVIAVIGLLLSVIDQKYGRHLIGTAKSIKISGELMAIIGILLMALILLVSGFCGVNWQIPHIFTEKGFYAPRGQSVAGIDLVDFVIGTLFLFGGLMIIGALLFGKKSANNQLSQTAKYTLSGLFLTWSGIILTVAGMGFLQEYRADLYSSSNDVPLADYGFAFRMLHLDVSLMLFPAIMLVMLIAQHFLQAKQNKNMQRFLRTGVLFCTLGSLVYMVLNPAAFGPGYWIVGLGFAFVVSGMIYFFVSAHHQETEKFDGVTEHSQP